MTTAPRDGVGRNDVVAGGAARNVAGGALDAGLARELDRELEQLDARGRRRPWPPSPPRGADFASNDYLGFARRRELIDAAHDALDRFGAGAGAARQLGGAAEVARLAERAVAEWLGAEDALLFPTGFQANLGTIGALVGRGDAVFSDALNHASLIDGVRLSRARPFVFAHLDLDELDAQLANARGANRRLVVVESVFSMDGDLAPLAELAELCARRDAHLVVDEAHAIGVLGPNGAGAWAAAEASGADPSRLAARIVTGGKALGCGGALAVGPLAIVETLANRARAFLFTTAPVPALVGALHRAVELARDAAAERERVLAVARTLAERLGLDAPDAAVLPFVVGDDADAVAAARDAQRQDLDVRAVRPPTVPEGTARLRLVAHAHNTDDEIERVVAALANAPRRALDDAQRAAIDVRPTKHDALVVVGTDTGIGKTVASAALLACAPEGTRYWKPVQTGVDGPEHVDDDTTTVRRLTGLAEARFCEPLARYRLPASPHEAAAAEGERVAVERLTPELERLRAESPLVVELAGGLLVPYDDARTQADWLAETHPRIALVARSGLGTLNHTLLTVEALRARRLEPAVLILVGEPHRSNRDTLAARLAPVPVVELPPIEPLDAENLRAHAEYTELARLAFGRTAAPLATR